jgi:hypothetical protein
MSLPVAAKITLRYLREVFYGADHLLNALTGGKGSQTISYRAALARNQGRVWGCVLCRWLDKIEKDHCSIEQAQNEH